MKSKIIICLIFSSYFLSCIDPLEFNASAPPQLLIIDGGISTDGKPYTVKLSYATEYGKQIFQPAEQATVRVVDDAAHEELLEEISPGIYQGKELQGVVGRSYSLEVVLSNGKTYRSTPEKIETPTPIDSISFNVTVEEITNDLGKIVERVFAHIYTHTTLPAKADSVFLRWDWESIYVFYESSPQNAKVCYISERLEPQRIALFDASRLEGGSQIDRELFEHIPDFGFNWRRSYYVWQYRISKEAYQYREQLEKIANPAGTIFDPTPAALRGNVFSLENPKEFVGGYFEASSVDTALIFVTRPEVARFVFLPTPCTNRHPATLPFSVCGNCLELENSTLERPDYWP